jgi:hypothetical protein
LRHRAHQRIAAAASPTSAATPRSFACGKARLSAATARSTLSFDRPLTMVSAPAPASPCAMARPMPPVEPVTSAIFPASEMFMACLYIR